MISPRIVSPENIPGDTLPLTIDDFSKLMAPAGPFEPAPHLAIAVSGGADSLALCLLANGWVRRRKGRVMALTVEHGLRQESAAEARQVGRWLKARNISHRILPWCGNKPTSGIQAAARAARMSRLTDWCARHHVLHLLTGHQMEDQAATVILRLSAGSGCDGLAAMPLVQDVRTPDGLGIRLIRPLLSVPEDRLKATLGRRSQAWIDDPSNHDRGYARTRLAASIDAFGNEGISVERLARVARRAGSDRAALDWSACVLLSKVAILHPAGFATLDWAIWRTAPESVSLRALIRLLTVVGGHTFGPRLERAERLSAELRISYPARAATLGGCRIMPQQGKVLICREPGLVEPDLKINPGDRGLWDNRFQIRLARRAKTHGECILGKLGLEGIAFFRRVMADRGQVLGSIPSPARPALPAFRDLDGLLAVPHLKYVREPGGKGCEAQYIGTGNRSGGVFGPIVRTGL